LRLSVHAAAYSLFARVSIFLAAQKTTEQISVFVAKRSVWIADHAPCFQHDSKLSQQTLAALRHSSPLPSKPANKSARRGVDEVSQGCHDRICISTGLTRARAAAGG
jgi:hypothetical protein